jgi:hypothetical protein
MQKTVSDHHKSFIFKILHGFGFCGNTFKLKDLCLPPWHGIFSSFAAIIAKRDCAIQFILTDKLEKTIAKSKQTCQHHSTHSGCSKTLIWRPSSNIPALAAFLVPVYLAFASCNSKILGEHGNKMHAQSEGPERDSV